MRVPRLFCASIRPGEVALPPEEAHHAGEVLRLSHGDPVLLFDGCGVEADATVVEANRRRMTVRVLDVRQRAFELPVSLTLAVALPKGPRQLVLVEKCTELGVATILPMITHRSVVKPSGIEKLKRRAIEACKQSGRAFVPNIEKALTMTDVLAVVSNFAIALIASPDESSPTLSRVLTELTGSTVAPPIPLLVLIGPEGGWEPFEIDRATSADCRRVSLGPHILRTETAAIAACASVAQFTK